MKAPGANTKANILVDEGRMVRPNTAPVPSNSRTAPSNVSAQVKPSPIPNPSKSEGIAVFLAAKASARPRMIQFTTIKGMKSPRLA